MTLKDSFILLLTRIRKWLINDRRRIFAFAAIITLITGIFLYRGIQKENMATKLMVLGNALDSSLSDNPESSDIRLNLDSECRYILYGYCSEDNEIYIEEHAERHPFGWYMLPMRLLKESDPHQKANMAMNLSQLDSLLATQDPLSHLPEEVQTKLRQASGILSADLTDASLPQSLRLYVSWETHPLAKTLLQLFRIILVLGVCYGILVYVRYLRNWRKQEIHSASALRRDSLNAIAHQIRTPLAALLGYTEAIELGIRPEKQTWYLSQIKTKGQEINELVDQILSIGQLEDKYDSMPSETISLANLLEDCIRQYPEVKFECSLNEAFMVNGCEEHCRRMLLCLLDNAVKYRTPNTPVHVRIQHQTLTIHNACKPLPKDFLPNAFRFHVQDDGHYSFGLYYAKKVCEASGLHLSLFNDNDGVTIQLF